MELTAQRKAFMGVLGVAAVALLVDQVLLQGEGGPASAAAGEAVVAPAAKSAAPKPQQAAAVNAVIADRLEALKSSGAVGGDAEAFRAPEGWFAVPEAPQAAATREVEEVPEGTYRLTSVLPNGQTPAAVVNGRTLRLGEQAGNMRLVRVLFDGAVIEIDGREYTLPLQQHLRGRE